MYNDDIVVTGNDCEEIVRFKSLAFIVYNDDIMVTGNDREEIAGFKSYLPKELEIKDPVDLHFFLGIKVLGQTMDLLQEVNRPIEAKPSPWRDNG